MLTYNDLINGFDNLKNFCRVIGKNNSMDMNYLIITPTGTRSVDIDLTSYSKRVGETCKDIETDVLNYICNNIELSEHTVSYDTQKPEEYMIDTSNNKFDEIVNYFLGEALHPNNKQKIKHYMTVIHNPKTWIGWINNTITNDTLPENELIFCLCKNNFISGLVAVISPEDNSYYLVDTKVDDKDYWKKFYIRVKIDNIDKINQLNEAWNHNSIVECSFNLDSTINTTNRENLWKTVITDDDGQFHINRRLIKENKIDHTRILKLKIDEVEKYEINDNVEDEVVKQLLEKVSLSEPKSCLLQYSNDIANSTYIGNGNYVIVNPNNTQLDNYKQLCEKYEITVMLSTVIPTDEVIMGHSSKNKVDSGVFVVSHNEKQYVVMKPSMYDDDMKYLAYFRRFKNPTTDIEQFFVG